MANQKQVERLQGSVNEWNTWRREHPREEIDLRLANLSGVDLRLADLSDTNLSDTNLSDANLSDANLSGADLSGADLSYTTLRLATLNGATLNGANLSDATLSGVDLRLANLSGANLSDTTLSLANLSGVDLSDTTLSGATLSGATLRLANLSGATLSGVDLRLANLSDANLSGANLSDANLSDANLSGAIIGWTSLGDRDLREVKGLETVRHRGPSPLSINTLYLSEGNIPELFLKGTGAPDTFIEYVRALTMRPIEYYTCFISYSSKDELFARRVHNDLQQEGVRCWFAPEDMDIGDKIKHRIDESIRMYDKLLLVLSEHSLASSWVEYEVERALQKEPKGVQNVLYPVRVDQAILRSRKQWARDIKESRHIGDFEAWTDPGKYDVSFQRLLRALNMKKGDQGKK